MEILQECFILFPIYHGENGVRCLFIDSPAIVILHPTDVKGRQACNLTLQLRRRLLIAAKPHVVGLLEMMRDNVLVGGRELERLVACLFGTKHDVCIFGKPEDVVPCGVCRCTCQIQFGMLLQYSAFPLDMHPSLRQWLAVVIKHVALNTLILLLQLRMLTDVSVAIGVGHNLYFNHAILRESAVLLGKLTVFVDIHAVNHQALLGKVPRHVCVHVIGGFAQYLPLK